VANRTISLDEKEKALLIDALYSTEMSSSSKKLVDKLDRAFKPRAPRYGKSKGAGFQIWIAEKLSVMLGFTFDNTDDDASIATRSMGMSGNDIILRGSAKASFPFDIEAKNVESLSVPATIEQAKANTGKDRKWLIAWKNKKFDEPVVIMSWSSFEYLWRRSS